MILRRPCKKCIVQPMCRQECDKWKIYRKSNNKIKHYSSFIVLFLIGYQITTIILGQYNGNFAILISTLIFISTVVQFCFILNYRSILKYQMERFLISSITKFYYK
jgi:hypothetical protein